MVSSKGNNRYCIIYYPGLLSRVYYPGFTIRGLVSLDIRPGPMVAIRQDWEILPGPGVAYCNWRPGHEYFAQVPLNRIIGRGQHVIDLQANIVTSQRDKNPANSPPCLGRALQTFPGCPVVPRAL